MELIKRQTLCMIIAEEGKNIRDKNDIYKEEILDNEGNVVEEEHIPHYTDVIFVPASFTEEQMNELYIEEEVEECQKQ